MNKREILLTGSIIVTFSVILAALSSCSKERQGYRYHLNALKKIVGNSNLNYEQKQKICEEITGTRKTTHVPVAQQQQQQTTQQKPGGKPPSSPLKPEDLPNIGKIIHGLKNGQILVKPFRRKKRMLVVILNDVIHTTVKIDNREGIKSPYGTIFRNLSPGKHRLTVTRPGHLPLVKDIQTGDINKRGILVFVKLKKLSK